MTEEIPWQWALKPGDRVKVIHSDGDSWDGVVVENEPGIDVGYVAVAIAGHRTEYYRRGRHSRLAFPKGPPAIVGDVSEIFPPDVDAQEMADRMLLRYSFSPNEMSRAKNDPCFNLPITTVRQILELLKQAKEEK